MESKYIRFRATTFSYERISKHSSPLQNEDLAYELSHGLGVIQSVTPLLIRLRS